MKSHPFHPLFISRDLTGQQFGRWSVIAPRHVEGKSRRHWLARCECGNEKVLATNQLTTGHSKSCGCLRQEVTTLRGRQNRKHGARAGLRNRTYTSWQSMIQRVTNPSATGFKYWGGRGVTIDPRWLGEQGFKNFLADMGERPVSLTLDRRDVDGNYGPTNCKWSSWSHQRRNQRRMLKAAA